MPVPGSKIFLRFWFQLRLWFRFLPLNCKLFLQLKLLPLTLFVSFLITFMHGSARVPSEFCSISTHSYLHYSKIKRFSPQEQEQEPEPRSRIRFRLFIGSKWYGFGFATLVFMWAGGGGYLCLAAERKNQFWAGWGIWSKILTVIHQLLESWTNPWSLIVKKPQDWQATNFVKIPKYVYRDHTLDHKHCYGAGAARSRKFGLKSEPET